MFENTYENYGKTNKHVIESYETVVTLVIKLLFTSERLPERSVKAGHTKWTFVPNALESTVKTLVSSETIIESTVKKHHVAKPLQKVW